jgi:hypothetical protein
MQFYKFTKDVPPQTILFGRVTAAFDDEVALLKRKQLGNRKSAITMAAVTSLLHVVQTLKEGPFF